MTEFPRYEPPTRVAPEREPAPEPAGWLVWPARVIALGIVLPVRLAWEALRAAGRGLERFLGIAIHTVLRALGFVLAPVGFLLLVPIRLLGRWIFCPATALLGRFLGLVLRYVVLPVLAALGAAAAALAHALAAGFRAVWSGLVAACRWIGRALVAVVAGIGWVLHRVLVVPIVGLARFLGRGLTLLGRFVGRALALVGSLLAVPLVLLWRWVLRPLAAGLGIALVAVGMAVWRYVLRPLLLGVDALVRGIGALFRAAGRAITWAWRTSGVLVGALGRFLVAVGRILATPFVWLYRHVLTPVGHAVRAVWRRCVLAPLAAVRRTVATASAAVRRATSQARAQVSAQMRVLFGRAR